MLKLQATNRLRNYGLSAVAAGFVFFAGPIAADASDFGGKLLTDGIENSHVETLQNLLVEEGYLQQKDADGVYDNATTDAVTDYQEDQQLLVDGLAGVQTLGALKVLGKGDENELVTDLQGTLQDSGYYNGSVDGYFDGETHDSVKSFQSDADIAVDGLAGPETFGALYYGKSKAVEEDTAEEEVAEEEATEEEPVEEEATEDEATEEEPVEEEATEDEATEEEPVEEDAAEDEATEEEPVEEEATEDEATEEEPVEEAPEAEATEEDESTDEEGTEEEPVEEDASEEEGTEEDSVEETTGDEVTEEDAVEDEASEADATEDEESTEDEGNDENMTQSSDAEGETYTMDATAYTADCDGCSGITATGIDLNNNRDANVVAVDPNVIPLGSTVHVEGYGEAVAGDTGGNITGESIDLHVPTQEEAEQFGRQSVEVTVLD
ncbi:peptidoglycan-binding protein [Salicibibacter cibarius]|uniref:Peptidoglycan-binding protein n=1 Tax=Salicibibacter cibarius TaxID=2743000 RepID=A0A7T6Z1Y8_9BACI|nr:peptidoglycan-binding protein [Salicibibacter cibarius]QQK75192.1 peptidoglycan-binding protein [Salicibibacter cibarius]